MNLNDWQQNWNELGKADPLWVVLTDPTKKGGRWKPEEFFATGREEIERVLTEVASLGIPLVRGRALDFGCGVGRLAQALAEHFEAVDGVDISPSMVDNANRFNRFPQKCHYHVNPHPDLRLFGDGQFDFIYSNITLQHIHPRFSRLYIRDFIRVLKPGGLAVFQIQAPGILRGLVPEWAVALFRRLKHRGQPFICMFGLRASTVERILQAAGAEILSLQGEQNRWTRWRSLRYFARKRR